MHIQYIRVNSPSLDNSFCTQNNGGLNALQVPTVKIKNGYMLISMKKTGQIQ